ncbi:MAG: hypothetical protein WDN04_18360 [Rhodospirillales bacterium]
MIKRSGWRGAAAVVAVSVVLPLCGAQAAGRTTEAEAQARAAWREAIVQTPTPAGCFNAEYPSTSWKAVACTVAPKRPYLPARGHARYTVGDGNDFAAVTTGLISSTTGTFPKIKGLTSENDGGTANSYSLQINSQFFNSPTCKGASNPANCLGWEQFVYSSDSRAAFMQYWLIRYNNTCPSGWFTNSNDCYKNSAAVNVPLQAISQLGNLKLVGAAGATTDKLTMTTDTKAYKTSGPDSVVGLAAFWNGSEFNIIGDGDGSRATFNTGTSLTVKVALATGGTDAPTCKGNSGTTAETNNLNLGKCTAKGGKKPFINFVESN